MRRGGYYVDTSVLLTAVGGPHPDRAACRALVRAARQGDLRLHVSVEVMQEFAFHRIRKASRTVAVEEARNIVSGAVVHAFEPSELLDALDLMLTTGLRGRDAVHFAIGRAAGFDHIVSLDTDFDGIPGFRRIHPADAT